MKIEHFEAGGIHIAIDEAPPLKFPSDTDCNSPLWWSEDRLYILNSTGHSIRSEGESLETLTRGEPIAYTAWRDGGRWIESVHQEADGTLHGWYHNEPAHLVPDQYQVGRQFPLTAPFIGQAVSRDNGKTWDDLGLIITGGEDTLELEHHNYWFAGGNGDFTAILDRKGECFYFLISTYYKDVTQQGVSLARLRYADRLSPVGKVEKWYQGRWQEPGLGGKVTPILPVNASWYAPEPDAFWGPSVHWNTHLQQYVILLNRAIDPGWKQEGIYICFTPDISDPSSWSEPRRLLAAGGWYPQLVGEDARRREADRELSASNRLFIHGESRWRVHFS